MIHTPDQVVPACTVPKPREEKNDKQIKIIAPLAFAITAERDIYIIAEKVTETDVPPAPKVADRSCGIREIEVLQEIEAANLSQANRHIRIAREVEVYLQGIGEGSEPQHLRRHMNGLYAVNMICKRAGGVGDEQLLGKADDEALYADVNPLPRYLTVRELLLNVFVPDDRAGDELREEERVEPGIERIVRDARIAAIDVYYIGKAVEGEEGNAQWQVHLKSLTG